MKRLLLISCLFGAMQSYSQELTCEGGIPKIQHIIDMPGRDASELYKLADRWIAKTFTNKDEVIQTTLKNEMIRGRGFVKGVKVAAMWDCDLIYTFTIDIKDNKYRFTMHDMRCMNDIPLSEYSCKRNGTVRQGYAINDSLLDVAESLIVSLHDFPTVDQKSDDW